MTKKPSKIRYYTPEEDALILSGRTPTQLARLLKRPRGSIIQRRHVLKTGKKIKPEKFRARFTPDETAIIRKHYPTCRTAAELLPLLPGRNELQIYNKAHQLKLKKVFAGDEHFHGHMELVDQVRLRAKQDGIPFSKLDKEIGYHARYFGNVCKTRAPNFFAILKAVEFFGGRLVIDWQDRCQSA